MNEESYKYPDLTISEFKPKSMLVTDTHIPERAKFPVIDAHNHLFSDPDPVEVIEAIDKVGVKVFINLTGNTEFTFDESGYTAKKRNIGYFMQKYADKYPGRFYCFTMSLFANLSDEILIKDENFTDEAIEELRSDIKKGAIGLKITKELGLRFKDYKNQFIPIDDKRLDPIWQEAGKIGIPVLIHASDPAAFFLPIDKHNEHYQTLRLAPDWSFYGSYFSKEELLAQRNRMIEKHPETTFICAHVANYPENLRYVSKFLDTHPNAYIDIAARVDELGRQPYTSREFFIKYQDRILFGTDMPPLPEVYRSYFRFLETRDEYFDYPDYIGRFGYSRWRIYGLYLPDNVLEKVYYKNALKTLGISI